MSGITVTVGHAPIPFSGMPSYGDSDALRSTAREALARLDAAATQAQLMCSNYRDMNWAQVAFETLTGSTYTQSICNRADQLSLNVNEYRTRINDPATTDAQLQEILGFINQETDISDLVDLYNSASASKIAGNALSPSALPWWVWAAGAAGALFLLGWRPLSPRRTR